MTSELTVFKSYEDGEHWFTATVESGTKGLIRVNIGEGSMDSEDPTNSQGMDITPKEARALAKLLEACANAVEGSLE